MENKCDRRHRPNYQEMCKKVDITCAILFNKNNYDGNTSANVHGAIIMVLP